MSVEAIAIALHHSRARKASTIAVLVGIANHDGDGGAWPTIRTLAHYARLKDRAVQDCLTELITLGEIQRDIQRGGTVEIAHYDRPNLFHFTLKCPPHCDGSRAHKLICRGCEKPLPKTSQTEFYHAACKPGQGHFDPVQSGAPGAAQCTGPVQSGAPKTYLETTTNDSEETYVGNRAPETKNDASGAAPVAVPAAAGTEPARAPKNDASGAPSHAVFDLSASVDALHALERDEAFEACPHWGGRVPHCFAPSTGECIDCGALDPARINQETGEVA